MGRNEPALAAFVIVPAMVSAGEAIPLDDPERQPHAAMGAPVVPRREQPPLRVRPERDFRPRQLNSTSPRRAGHGSSRRRHARSTLRFASCSSGCPFDIHRLDHGMRRTEPTGHMESVHHLGRAGHLAFKIIPRSRAPRRLQSQQGRAPRREIGKDRRIEPPAETQPGPQRVRMRRVIARLDGKPRPGAPVALSRWRRWVSSNSDAI